MKLHLLRNGSFVLNKSFLIYLKYMDQTYQAAAKPLLITAERMNILVDTGIGRMAEDRRKLLCISQRSDEHLQMQLIGHDLRPSDIDIVINTHLHFDHCGNNELFRNAKFIVQRDELRYAYKPERFQEAAYVRDLFDLDVDYETIKGRHQILDGVVVVPTPGHSVGHQSVVVTWDGRNFVYCGDAAPLRENLERRNIPGIFCNGHKALRSIDRLRKIENGIYIYSHDNEQRSIA